MAITFEKILSDARVAARTDTDIERRLRLFAADCAGRALHIFEREQSGDARPRNAILASRQFVFGETSEQDRMAAAVNAFDAAQLFAWVLTPEARAAEYAANAAGDAAGHALTLFPWTLRSASKAAEWAALGAAGATIHADLNDEAILAAAQKAERQWQFDRLIARLSDNEPEDWPLPEKSAALLTERDKGADT